MSEQFRMVPDQEGMKRADRWISIASGIAFLVFLAGSVASWNLMPLFVESPLDFAAQLRYGLLCLIPVMVVLIIAIGMVSNGRRYSPQDIGGSAASGPSPGLAVPVAFLQNSLEQAVLAGGVYLIYSVLMSGNWLHLLPPSVAMFVIGRVLFLKGYPRGVEGRALGMAMTITPSLLLLFIVIGSLIWRSF